MTASTGTPIVELRNVSRRFGGQTVHRDISFSLTPGETVTILGPSGTGKTLILKMIMGLLRPTSGEVWVMGQRVDLMSEPELRRVRRDIGMLFQGAALFDSLDVFDNIAYPLRERGEADALMIAQVVAEQLERVGLPQVTHKFPAQLSGGQKKRVALARALASSPKVMLFDEPTTGLDPTAIRLIDELIIQLDRDLGLSSIIVTHDIQSAQRTSQRWILLNEGKVVADGPPETISIQNPLVSDFISGNWAPEMQANI